MRAVFVLSYCARLFSELGKKCKDNLFCFHDYFGAFFFTFFVLSQILIVQFKGFWGLPVSQTSVQATLSHLLVPQTS